MERMFKLDVLIPRILPQVLPCPRSMVADALQAVAVDFCKETEVWCNTFTECVSQWENSVEVMMPTTVEIIRIKRLAVEGVNMGAQDYYVHGRIIYLHKPVAHECTMTIEAVLRPSRFSEHIPQAILEEWGDIIAYGAQAKIKAMSGRGIEWSDPQGATIAMELYSEGVRLARTSAMRAKYGGNLYALQGV